MIRTLQTGSYLQRILHVYEIGLSQKGCNRIYNKLMMYDSNIIKENVKEKWESVLNEDISYGTIENTFKVLPKWEEGAHVKYFQFKRLHNRTITNKNMRSLSAHMLPIYGNK